MHRLHRSIVTAVVGALGLVGAVTASASAQSDRVAQRATPMCGTRSVAPTYKHVIVIVDENHSAGSVVKSSSAPYINKVIAACGLATNYHNLTHLSLPNYLGMTYGGSLSQLNPYLSDCNPGSCSSRVGANNLFNQVASRGWRSFEESMPHPCAQSPSGSYAPKHNPAVYYSDLASSCATHDLSLGKITNSPLLKSLAKESTAPAFSFVTPNLCSDMHSCSTGTGDSWLKTWLPKITASTVYKNKDTVVFITWDEGEPGYNGENCVANTSDQSCHVPAIVVGPSVPRGTKVGTSFSHYSLLKTIEDLLGVAELGGAQSATSMVSGFNL